MPEKTLPVLPQQNHIATAHAYQDHSETVLSNGLSVNDNPVLPSDEYWLYKPPSLSTSGLTPVVPIESWLREVFDSPAFGFYSCRRNLLTRLEAILAAGGPIAAYRFGGSVPSLNSISQSQSSTLSGHFPSSHLPVVTGDVKPFIMPSMGSSDSISVLARRSDGVNGYTVNFGRLEQPNYSLPPQFSRSQRFAAAPSNSISHLSQSGGITFGRKRSGSAGKMGSCDALESLQTTVQEIARMQEDNLKADVAALVAASAGKYGSQHSLGSQGQHTPEGSCLRLASAPGSPASSNPYLNEIQTIENELSDNIVYPHNRSSLEFLSHHQATSGHPNDLVHNSHDSASSILCSQTTGGQLQRPSSLHRLSIPVLPPKPIVPVVPMRPFDAPGYSMVSHIKPSGPTPLVEAKTQFGFRPRRKISAPQFLSKPPVLPSGARRSSNIFTQQSME